MKRNIAIIFAVLIVLVWTGDVFAVHGSVAVGAGHTGPVTTIPATTLPKGGFAFDIQTEFISFDRFSEAKLHGFAERDMEIHDVDYLMTSSLGLTYGISDFTTLHLRIPYIYRDDISESDPPDEVHRHGDAKGFGDISFHLHHKVYQSEKRDFLLTVLAGLEMPTGKTNDRDNDGATFETEFQPGSGSWDPSLGIAMTRRLGDIIIDGNILYTLVTEGTQDTDLGDIFTYNLAVSYRAMKESFTLDLFAEINGIWVDKEEADGHEDRDSGGNTIFLSPGLRLGFGKNLMFYGSYSLPVIQDLNGNQNETDYRLVFGINLVI